jgi:acyl carrier protein
VVVGANNNYFIYVCYFTCICPNITASSIYLHFILNSMEKLKQIFAAVLGLKPDQVLKTLSPENCPSWDSLNSIVLITEIEKAFAIRFTFDEAMAVKNFADAIALVASKGGDVHE